MNKFLTTLLAGAFTLSLGSAAFAADTAKTAEAVKTEAAAKPAVDAPKTKAAATKKSSKKQSHHHAKKSATKSDATHAAQGALTSK
jgi:hypothetical protein